MICTWVVPISFRYSSGCMTYHILREVGAKSEQRTLAESYASYRKDPCTRTHDQEVCGFQILGQKFQRPVRFHDFLSIDFLKVTWIGQNFQNERKKVKQYTNRFPPTAINNIATVPPLSPLQLKHSSLSIILKTSLLQKWDAPEVSMILKAKPVEWLLTKPVYQTYSAAW